MGAMRLRMSFPQTRHCCVPAVRPGRHARPCCVCPSALSLHVVSTMPFSPMLSQTPSHVSRSKQLATLDQAETFAASAEEVDNHYGLRDPKAAASMAQYISGASPKEKQRYIKLIAKAAVTDPLSQALDHVVDLRSDTCATRFPPPRGPGRAARALAHAWEAFFEWRRAIPGRGALPQAIRMM